MLSFKHNFVPQLILFVVAAHLNASEHADVAPDGGVGVVGDVTVGTAADFLAERSVRSEEQYW